MELTTTSGFHYLKSLGVPPVNLRGRENPYHYKLFD